MIIKVVKKILIFLLLAIPILEMALRLFNPQQLITDVNIFVPDTSGLGIRLAPNLDKTINTGEGNARLITDDKGYRISGDTQASSDINILALGDSFLLALQVDYEETMTAILEKELSTALDKSSRIVNTGVGAYSPNHYLILAKNELKSNNYDMVLVFVYLGNDIIESVDSSFPPITRTTREFRVPKNLSKPELVDALLYPINDILEKKSHLFVLLKNQISNYLAKIGLTARYFPDNLLISSSESDRWKISADVLSSIEYEASKYNIPVIYILIPSPYQIDVDQLTWAKESFGIKDEEIDLAQPSRRLSMEMKARKLNVIDLYEPLRNAYLEKNLRPYGNVDSHLSKDGHKFIANYVLSPILSILMGQK